MSLLKKNKELFLFVVFLSAAVLCLITAIIYSSVIPLELQPYPNGPLYTGLKAHLISKHYYLVKILLSLSFLTFIASIVFLIKLLIIQKKKGNKTIKWIENNKDLVLFIIFFSVAIICFITAIVYSSAVKLELLPDSDGPLYMGILAHLVSDHYHLVKIMLPLSLISFIVSIVFLIKSLLARKKKVKSEKEIKKS